MGLFSKRDAEGDRRRRASYLPPKVSDGLEPFGRFMFDPSGSGVDTSTLFTNDLSVLMLKQEDPARFIAEVAAIGLAGRGWTLYGAFKVLWEYGYLADIPANADATAVMMAATGFLRDQGFRYNLNMDENAAFLRAGGHPW